ncbi:MAG: methyltransferase [Alphaproteobacteria bacterium]|nr:methyltransferase [Alphaproteobacteria bacterium]MCB9974463.1 methyltransferase [Rhodospirillales bacterium]
MNDPTEPIAVLNRRVLLHQPANGFRTSLDSVMLAAACTVKSGQSVLDLGCGVGSAGLCVAARVPGIVLSGIDIQADHVALAEKNAALNGVAANFTCADIRNYEGAPQDHVITNPPYAEAGKHMPSPSSSKALARGHIEEDLNVSDWVEAGLRNVKNGGSLTLIHMAGETHTIIQALGKRFGAVEIIPLWPRAGVAAKRVILRAIRNRKTPSVIHPGLVLHEADGAYTQAAERVLRDGAGLF